MSSDKRITIWEKQGRNCSEKLQIRKRVMKRRLKTPQIGKKDTLNAVENRALVEFYGENKQLMDRLIDLLGKYKISGANAVELIKDKDSFLSFSVSILDNDLSPLEAVVQYLRELGYSLKEIAVLLNRSNKTIWTTYHNASLKKVKIKTDAEPLIPLSVVSNRKLGALESISVYLREEFEFSFIDIATMLGRDKNTIYTSYKRAQVKNGK